MTGQTLATSASDRATGTDLGVGYRTIFRTKPQVDAIEVAERHVRGWLGDKLGGVSRLDDWDGVESRIFDRRYSISVAETDDATAGVARRLYRLSDANSAGTFVISIYAARVAEAKPGLIVVQGAQDRVSDDAAIDSVGTPRFVRDLLDELQPLDGVTPLTSKPQFVRSADVGSVLDAITDEARIGSVIVASSPGVEVDSAWSEIVSKLTRNSVGVASIFVVAADAVDALNQLLPASHDTPPGRVRTYGAGVQLDDPLDGRAHRFLGPSTLSRAVRGKLVIGKLPAVHARGPRLRLLERALPADVRRTIELLDRAERRQRIATQVAIETPLTQDAPSTHDGEMPEPERKQTTAPAIEVRPPVLATLKRVVARWLGREQLTEVEVADLDTFIATNVTDARVAQDYIVEVEAENDRLLTELTQLRGHLDEAGFEIALSSDELRASNRENQLLKARLRELHEFGVPVDADSDRWAPPADVEELIARITPGEEAHFALDYVEFTGDSDAVAELRKRDPYGKYASDLWDYVRVLVEYATLRKTGLFEGSVYMYLEQDEVEGFKCSPQRHAARESDSVLQNSKWRSERELPVPTTVDPTGRTLMQAHFKPTHRDQFAPRMYYFDDMNSSGKIYIGYVGRHLSNTKTS